LPDAATSIELEHLRTEEDADSRVVNVTRPYLESVLE
jgi:hypothetical protein